MSGFIKLDRSILDWEWYDHAPTKILFFHLLLKANYKASKYRGLDIPVGALVAGVNALSEQTGLSVQQTRTALNNLKKTGEITTKATNKFSIITLNNWLKYQEKKEEPTNNKQTNNKQTTNKQQSNNIQSTTSKEINNKKTSPYGELKKAPTPSPKSCEEMKNIWNEVCGGTLKQTQHLSPRRIMRMNSVFREYMGSDLEQWRAFCDSVNRSPFLTGRVTDKDGKGFFATIDWVLDEDNFLKVLEGNYSEDHSSSRTERSYAPKPPPLAYRMYDSTDDEDTTTPEQREKSKAKIAALVAETKRNMAMQ